MSREEEECLVEPFDTLWFHSEALRVLWLRTTPSSFSGSDCVPATFAQISARTMNNQKEKQQAMHNNQ